ncbi:MAG: hypothetical protein JST00_27375 [Deltaproteobacteria bacterium]|nr:hypothetical protein [Deltaproteobacteria bacterium]
MRWKAGNRLIALALLCNTAGAFLLFGAQAHANGRFPQAQAIESVPGSDGKTIFMRATFGILVSRDAGKTWRWICERAWGYEGTWDPATAVTRDGRIWVGLERSLVSSVDGCVVDTSHELDGETVRDLTTDLDGKTLWAVTGAPDKQGAIWRREIGPKDAKFEKVGPLPESFNPSTIEVAPSKPSRLYVTGQPWETIRGWLLRSDDGGKTIVPGVGGKNDLEASGPFFLAAVDPKDPNRALLRHLHATGSDVLLTTDGGKTLKNVLSMKSAMFGFAKSPDGMTYWAGSGLAEHGILRSTDRGEHFEEVARHGVLCLHAAPGDRLFLCENTFSVDAKTVSLSLDRGKTITPIASFKDILGPQTCDAGADGGAALCDAVWPETLAMLTPREAGAPDAGARKRRRDAGAGEAGADVTEAAPRPKSTCGCIGAGIDSGLDHRWLSAGLLPLAAWARARRRPGSRATGGGADSPRDAG